MKRTSLLTALLALVLCFATLFTACDAAAGAPGAPGEKGEQGIQGEQGLPGEKGDKGDKGDAGENGISVISSMINAEGHLIVVLSDGRSIDAGKVVANDGAPGTPGEKGDKGDKGDTGEAGKDGTDGKDGNTPYIKDGNWWIGNTDTGVKAEGKDGVDGQDGKDGADGKDGLNGADGEDGKDGLNGTDGKNGTDGLTPYIKDGNWWIGETDTGVRAEGRDGAASEKGEDGKDGDTPYIKNGNWWIGDTDTGVRAEGKDGVDGQDGKDGVNGTNGKDGKDGADGKDGEDGKDGVGVVNAYVDTETGHLMIELSNGETIDAGQVMLPTPPVIDDTTLELPDDLYYDDRDIHVLTRPAQGITSWGSYDIVYDDSLDYDSGVMNAIKTRNENLYDRLGVNIYQITASDVYTTAAKDILTNQGNYDIIVPRITEAAKLIQRGYLLSTDDLPYMNTEKVWYDQNSIRELAVNGKSYAFESDITVLDNDATCVFFFNEELISQYDLDDPYSLVTSGKWDIDTFLAMCETATVDDGDATATKNDYWGLAGNDSYITTLYVGMGGRIASTDSEIRIMAHEGNTNTFLEKISELRPNWARYSIYGSGDPYGFRPGDNYAELVDLYQAGQTLFVSDVVVATNDFTSRANFLTGMVPAPKISPFYEKYHSLTAGSVATALCVPSTAKDAGMVSATIEYWSYESNKTLIPAYYDTFTENEKIYVTDDILDIIFGSVSYDYGIINNWGDLSTKLMALGYNGGSYMDFIKMYSQYGDIAQTAANEFSGNNVDFVAPLDRYDLEINGEFWDLEEACICGVWELSTTDVTVNVLRDLTQEDFAAVGNYLSIFNYETDAEGNPVKITFDFQGHSLTGITTGYFFRLGATGAAPDRKSDITIKNMIMTQSGAGSFCQVYAGGNYTFENCIFTAENAFNWSGINANVGDNTDNPTNINLTNVVMHMPTTGGPNNTVSFVRTGNTSTPSSDFKNEEGKYTVLGKSPIVNFNITNCLFDADLDEGEVLEGNDKGVIGIHVTSERSTVVVKNSTIIAPQPIYITTSLRNYTDDVIRGNDVVTVIDSVLDNSDKTPNSKPDAIYCGEDFATVNDDPTVENGYQEP